MLLLLLPLVFAKPNATYIRARSTHIAIVQSESIRWCRGRPTSSRFAINGTFFDRRTGKLLGLVVVDGKQIAPEVGWKPPRPQVAFPHLIIGGGVTLVSHGKVVVRLREEKFRVDVVTSRRMSAIGRNKAGDKCVLLSTSNRSIHEVAKLMKGYGCYTAMRLDGGGSTFFSMNNRMVVCGRTHNSVFTSSP